MMYDKQQLLPNSEIKENFSRATVFCDTTINHLVHNCHLTDNDARVVYFRKISQINDMTNLSYDFYDQYLLGSQYWENKFPNFILSRKNKRKLAEGYDDFIRTTFAIENYSAFESSIRVIAESYDLDKYNKDTRFSNICKWFLPDVNLKEQISIVKLFSNIRNTLHSNGVFNPPSQKDEKIIYQGKTFEFKVGEPIVYGDWHNLLSMTKVITKSFYTMIENPKINSIAFIKEPMSKYW